jgi:hypothetical protein
MLVIVINCMLILAIGLGIWAYLTDRRERSERKSPSDK